MDKNTDDQDKKNNNSDETASEKNVSDDELLSKLLNSEDYEEDSDTEKNQANKKIKAFEFKEILGILSATIFITFVILLVYMKYSHNCGLLGGTLERLIGNHICKAKVDEQVVDLQPTQNEQINQTIESKKQDEVADNDNGKLIDKDGIEIIDNPFADIEQKEQNSGTKGDLSAININSDSQNVLSEQQKKDLASTFDKSKDGLAVQAPPEPVYETPGLIISETKMKITNRQPVRIKSLGFKDGQEFSKGDILVIFDCKQIELDLDIQKEILKDRQASFDNLQKLKKLKSTSDYSVVKAESELGQTKKIISKYEDQLSDCVIKSDYAGKVVVTSATEGEFLFAGKEIMTVINNEDLLVKAYVPVDWLDWLKIGSTFKLCIGADCFDGVVNRIGAEVDAISQTLDVFGKIPAENNNNKLIPGLSGQITFDKP